jgi:hypothetical protein
MGGASNVSYFVLKGPYRIRVSLVFNGRRVNPYVGRWTGALSWLTAPGAVRSRFRVRPVFGAQRESPECEKRINTMQEFLDHLAKNAMPALIEWLSVKGS